MQYKRYLLRNGVKIFHQHHSKPLCKKVAYEAAELLYFATVDRFFSLSSDQGSLVNKDAIAILQKGN